MARFSAMVIQQSGEKFKKLTLVADEVMQCGISLAEDLLDSGDIYVDEIEKCLMELAVMTRSVNMMQEAITKVDDVVKEPTTNNEKPPDLAECFRTELQSLNMQPYDPKNHSRIIQFVQQVREGCDESEEEVEAHDVDDDLVLGHIQRSLNCPLTKKYFEDPVTSKSCNHSYSKAAILEHIKKRSQCPVCNAPIKENDLRKDEKLQRKVWKAKKLEKKKRISKEGVVKL